MNKFKVGDKVAFYYGFKERFIGVVECIFDDMLDIHMRPSFIDDYNSRNSTLLSKHNLLAHYKQCRKLAKKKDNKLFDLGKFSEELARGICNVPMLETSTLPKLKVGDLVFHQHYGLCLIEHISIYDPSSILIRLFGYSGNKDPCFPQVKASSSEDLKKTNIKIED